MARLVIDGFGQVEINNCAFRRDGRVEAQCALSDDFAVAPAENGMLLAVDLANKEIKLPVDGSLPIALHYSAEHIYDERAMGLKNFSLKQGDVLPRLGYLSVGDTFTTNCLSGISSEDDVEVGDMACASTDGSIEINGNAGFGPMFVVVEKTTMPDGQFAVMLQCVEA